MKNRHFKSIGALLIVVAMLVGMIGTTGVVWAEGTLTVTYNSNGGTGTEPTDNNKYTAGDSVTVLGNTETPTLSRTNYTFAGWSSTIDSETIQYKAGDKFTMPATDVTLYAVWQIDDGVSRDSVILHKFIQADPDAAIPAKNFTCTITPLGIGSASDTLDMPVLTIGTCPSTTASQNTTEAGSTYQTGETHANTVEATNSTTLTFKENSNLTSSTFDVSTANGVKWPYAGVYRYYISEMILASTNDDWTYMTDGNTGYQISIYVENENDTLVTKYVVVNEAKYDTNPVTGLQVPVVGDKVDASDLTTENTNGDGFEFTNRYDPEVNLVIQKQVTGNAADMTKLFKFTISDIVLPDEKKDGAPNTYNLTYSTDSNIAAKYSDGTVRNTAATTITVGNNKVVYLGNKESVTIADLPVGTTYKVTEEGQKNYTATYQVEEAGTDLTKVSGTLDMDLSSTGTVKLEIVDAAKDPTTGTSTKIEQDLQNNDAYTNDYTVTTPTGIILSNLPAFAAIFCALGLAVFALIARRKRSR